MKTPAITKSLLRKETTTTKAEAKEKKKERKRWRVAERDQKGERLKMN